MRLLPNDRDEGWTPYAWLIYSVIFACWPAMKHGSTPLEWTLTLAGLVVFLALYFRGYWECGIRLMAIIAALTLLGVLYWPWNGGAGSFFIYAAAFAGDLQPSRRGIQFIIAIEVVVIAQSIVLQMPWYNFIWPLVFSALIGAINMHYRQRKIANARLRLAHDEIERLAKAAERERIARDLHDLLGHTLSLIILKSELASKLADRDAARARDEIRDVERISREALTQVRAAVRGYREGGLRRELDSARESLATAGIHVHVDAQQLNIPAAHEAVLALAIREAITNVVRHARARRCDVTVVQEDAVCIATVHDDGVGGNAEPGTGLTGMRERVESLGGTLRYDGTKGMTITITLPLANSRAIPFASERTA
jgi:two-component system, NarL family, sensor histidine kinase DesK